MQTETLSTTSDIVTPSVESPSERPTYPTVDQFGKPYRPLYLALLQYAADHNGVIEVQDAALKTLMGAQHYRLSTAIADFLGKRNRYAIPFNEVYGPGLADGEILSPLLDKNTVLTTLDNAKG